MLGRKVFVAPELYHYSISSAHISSKIFVGLSKANIVSSCFCMESLVRDLVSELDHEPM